MSESKIPMLDFSEVMPPPKKSPIRTILDEFEEKVSSMSQEVEDHEVKDNVSSKRAVNMASQAKQMISAIEDRRLEVVRPYKKITSEIDKKCKALSDKLFEIQSVAEEKNKPYLVMKKREHYEKFAYERAKALIIQENLNREYALKGETAPLIVTGVPNPYLSQTDLGEQKLKKVLTWEVLDFHEIPLSAFNTRRKQVVEALSPWINSQIREGVISIPGIRIFEETIIKTILRR